MSTAEFLKQLKKLLHGLPKEDVQRSLDYYREMIQDRTEEGLSEQQAVAAIGTPQQAAEQIWAEHPEVKRSSHRGLKTALIIIGSPIWLSLAVVALALIISMWAIIASLYITDASLIIAALALVLCCFFAPGYSFVILYLAAAFIISGLALVMFPALNFISSWAARLTTLQFQKRERKKRNLKPLIIVSVIFIVLGAALAIAGCFAIGFDFTRLDTQNLVPKSCEITSKFDRVFVDEKSCAISVLPSSDGVCRVEYSDGEYIVHDVQAANGVLKITHTDNRKWYQRMGFYIFEKRVIIYLPPKEYGSITLQGVSGSIDAQNLSVQSLDVSAVSGNISIDGAEAKDANLKLTSGNIALCDVVCRDSMTAQTVSGNISLLRCDAQDLYLKAVSGNITGSLLSPKVFSADSVSGKVSLPPNGENGKLNAHTTSGNIKLSLD